jgi:hypothetical protein
MRASTTERTTKIVQRKRTVMDILIEVCVEEKRKKRFIKNKMERNTMNRRIPSSFGVRAMERIQNERKD